MTTSTATPATTVPDSPAAAAAVAERLAATLDRAMGGPIQRAFEQLRPPVERFQANGVIAGLLGENTITTLDGETFGAELAPPLRKWVEKHPEAAAAPARWIVYPRTIPGGLAFYVVGQRRALLGETEAQLNRQVDRFTVTGTLTNSRGLRKQTCIRICRNAPVPKPLRKHPSHRPRFLFLAGLPPAPTKSWWNTDVRIQAQRVGRELKILAMAKVGSAAVMRSVPIGGAELPWPWKPSSQAIWRLCERDDLAAVPPWPCSEAEANQMLRRYLAVLTTLLVEVAPSALARQAGKVVPAKRAELEGLARHHLDLLRQWLAKTDRWLEGLPPAERTGLGRAHQLKQRLAMAAVVDMQGVFEQEGDRFWFDGWPIRGRSRRVLLENLPLEGSETLGGIEAQEAPPVQERKTRKRPTAPLNADAVIDQLIAQAKKEDWPKPLLHLRLTRAVQELV